MLSLSRHADADCRLWSAQEVVLSVLPTVLPLLLSVLFGTGFLDARCEFRTDKCNCLTETHPLVLAVQTVSVAFHYFPTRMSGTDADDGATRSPVLT
eukprot:3171504-Rhodomonas_salina.2